MTTLDSSWINSDIINKTLAQEENPSFSRLEGILEKASDANGMNLNEIAALTHIKDPRQLSMLFDTAKELKEKIYGTRIVMFAPMYISNLCKNECVYCAFRASNKALTRRILSQSEIAEETRILVNQGHKRVLVVAGESYPTQRGIDYVLESIATIYATKGDKNGSEIRRINANLAPLSVDDFGALKSAGIGTYQIFQETYDRVTYDNIHISGKKKDFDWRVTAVDRAMEAGIDDVGMGVLFGLSDWRFDLLGMMQHVSHLEDKFGVGCHTISMPRLEPAHGSDMASSPPHAVSDDDFKKIVAITRLAVPYTGIIMSTRESAEMRKETYSLGVSQISAGSRTNPGGYAADAKTEKFDESQFQLGDHRNLDEVVVDLAQMGYIPSFCTGCYRVGRTGDHFMEWAKSGKIHEKCGPNALSTFLEYLTDYASQNTKELGKTAIAAELKRMPERDRNMSLRLIAKVNAGKRDCYC